MTAVDVFIKDDSLIPLPVAGVVVSFYDAVTLVLVTTATTNGLGQAAVSLPDDTYEVRCFKYGYAIAVAQIVVDTLTPTTNKFDATATNLTVLPVATDPRMCRCTGVFVNYEGRPTSGVSFRLMANALTNEQKPKVVDGKLVFSSEMSYQTDKFGKVTLDLFRGALYYVVFSGDDDETWCLNVPDRSSANLINLIFPAPVSVEWDTLEAPGNALSVAVGETKIVHVSLLFTDFIKRSMGLEKWITFLNSDAMKMDLGYSSSDGAIAVKGIAVGAAQVTAELAEGLRPFRVPNYSLIVPSLLVTITP